MFEVPFNLILINPAVDIFIFTSILYFFIYKLYKILLEKDVEKIMWIDLQITIILLLLGYLNYADSKINFFELKVDWWFYVILMQFLVESVFVLLNWNDVKKYLKKIKVISKKNEEENLDSKIKDLKSFVKFMEENLEISKMESDEDEIQSIKKEIQKVEKNILELEKDLRDFNKNKND